MAKELKMIAHSSGFVITVVIDGDVRPDCKRASLHRRKWMQLDDFQRIRTRMKVVQLSSIINVKNQRNENASEETKQMKDYTIISKKLEGTCNNSFVIPQNFGKLLSEKLIQIGACVPNENGGNNFTC